MAGRLIRGFDRKNEQNQRQLIRDTRTLWQRFADFFSNPTSVVVLIVTFAAAGFFLPAAIDLLFIMGVLSFIAAFFRKASLPFRMPLSSHLPDYNDPKAGSDKPNLARGISFFGNDLETNEELWFNNED